MLSKGRWSKHPLYATWKNVKRKGQEGWVDFGTFLESIGSRPKGMILCKKDKEGLFGPTNWVWTTRKSKDGAILHDGKLRTESDIARLLAIPRTTIRSRLAAGWSLEQAVTTPPRKTKRAVEYWITANGTVKGHVIENKVICKRGSLQGVWEYLLECVKACTASGAKCSFCVMKSDKQKTETIARTEV